MMQILENEKKASQMVTPLFYGLMIAAMISYIVIFLTPVIGELPVEITEEVEILVVTEKGVVFETSSGVAVVTDQYSGEPGDVIEVTYSVPSKYLDDKRKQQVSFDAFHPDS
ncbi:MAG: hypothetical protein NPMRTH4_1770003 [Nitrosopumilales archaeon]|nr:MAG: hypothetical protein NPMRTH4_1770003 [Nitrosopumilales archaeon]